MPGRLLLDTSVIVDLFAGDSAVQRVMRAADEVFVSSIALGELFFGAQKSARREANLSQLQAFASAVAVLPVTTALPITTAASRTCSGPGVGRSPRTTSGSPLRHASMG